MFNDDIFAANWHEITGFYIVFSFSCRMTLSDIEEGRGKVELTVEEPSYLKKYEKQSPSQRTSRAAISLKAICTFMFFIVLLGCFVWTKVSFLAIAEAMHDDIDMRPETRCRLFVMLQIMALVPNVFNLFRGIWNGSFREDVTSPDTKQVLMAILISVLEATGICFFTFNIPVLSKPHHVILLMSCVFVVPLLARTVHSWRSDTESKGAKSDTESRGLVITAFIFEIIALGITAYLLHEAHIQELLMAPIGILFLSVSWTSDIQNFLVKKKDDEPTVGTSTSDSMQNGHSDIKKPPTWKIVAIMATFKLLFTFGISYMIFAIRALSPFPTVANMTHSETWSNYASGWDRREWQAASDYEIALFVSHIVCGVTGCVITTIASKACMRRAVLIPALVLCSPISILVLVLPGPCRWILIRINYASVCIIGKSNNVSDVVLVIVAVGLFLSAVTLSSVWMLWKTEYLCNLREDQLFWLPSYNSIFLDQWIMLNRKMKVHDAKHMDPKKMSKKTWIYICTTMYRETESEMKQYLKSIKNVQTAQSKTERNVEAHIFFDDAFELNGDQTILNTFASCLVGLVNTTLKLEERVVYETPYGECFTWTKKSVTANKTEQHEMPFNIHFKDARKVKKKKRWSQIMYMSYILDVLVKRKKKSTDDKNDQEQKGAADQMQGKKNEKSENSTDHQDQQKQKGAADQRKKHSYLLVTDADVKFTYKSVEFLIDLMLRDRSVGAACARTYPLGSGPLVWYQEFEYAIGHWFQKAAENVLGTVLCSPGCFSIYRCEAVADVLPIYAEDVKSAFDVLTKDMGEDRWFCTLMIQSGWFIEYCAAANNKTHCPENFGEFFKQRRRWIVSTLANLLLLLKKWDYIKRHNNRVSSLFRVYQAALLFASLVGPSTIILVVSGGLKYGWDLNPIPTLIIQTVLCFTFGIICVFTSSQMKISAAKFFTIMYAIIMTPVLVGMAVQITTDFIHTPSAEPNYIDANIKVSTSTVYLSAMTCIFVITGILHTMEMFYLFHGIWYLLCLPGGYLILMIYSICNITDSSWGTREMGNEKIGKKKSSPQIQSWSDLFTAIYRFCSCCAGKGNGVDRGNRPGTDNLTTADENEDSSTQDIEVPSTRESYTTNTLEKKENDFWTYLVDGYLAPKSAQKGYDEDLAELRNEWLMVLTVSNMLWLILITTLSYQGDILNVFGTSIVGLAVLVMLGILSLIQFLAMFAHRISTFVHYLGRVPLFVFDKENRKTSGETKSLTARINQMFSCCRRCKGYDVQKDEEAPIEGKIASSTSQEQQPPPTTNSASKSSEIELQQSQIDPSNKKTPQEETDEDDKTHDSGKKQGPSPESSSSTQMSVINNPPSATTTITSTPHRTGEDTDSHVNQSQLNSRADFQIIENRQTSGKTKSLTEWFRQERLSSKVYKPQKDDIIRKNENTTQENVASSTSQEQQPPPTTNSASKSSEIELQQPQIDPSNTPGRNS